MRFLTFIIILFFSVNVFGLSLTDEQFKNLSLIDKQLKTKYPEFKGFNGSAVDMDVMGVDDKVAQAEIDKLDIKKLKEEDPKRVKIKTLRNKLKALGLTDDELLLLNLQNDIED